MRQAILGTGVAVPEKAYDQSEVRTIIRSLFADDVVDIDRLLKVFEHDHIATRHFVRPPEWYALDRTFEDSNKVFAEASIELSLRAAKDALHAAGLLPRDLCGIVVASTTGLMTPSIDAELLQLLDMERTALRLPIFGLGCAAGVSGLARAFDLSRAHEGRPLLFVAVEICSTTFQRHDTSKSNLIGCSLFADGAAAVVVGSREDSAGGLLFKGSHSTLFDKTQDMMGWTFSNTGMQVRFSRDIPAFIRERTPSTIGRALDHFGVEHSDITSFITHPGGARVLDAFMDAANLEKQSLEAAYDVLRAYGNMSSASVLFVLHRMITTDSIDEGYALMSALGPGFSSDHLLLQHVLA
jgi:alkylresorcinol/alkylpyrone synthase